MMNDDGYSPGTKHTNIRMQNNLIRNYFSKKISFRVF